MTIGALQIDTQSAEPVYRQIALEIRRSVLDGRLEPGSRLPATRDLARQLGVNRNTVVAAYDALATEGWIASHTGRGTFVVERTAIDTDEPTDTASDETLRAGFSRTVECAAVGGLQSIYRLAISDEGISFVGSYPAGDHMPVESFAASLQAVLEEDGAKILGYGPTAGDYGLRETIAETMRAAGSDTTPENTLVTSGAQQAIELVFRTFVERGDAVVIEEPTYTGALSVLNSLGARIVGVPVDEQGIRPDLLEVALERHHPKFLYVQPTFHNPTAAEMSPARRREVVEICRRHRCLIVEDDWAGDLRLEGERLPTLHALAGSADVIYLSTFSKKLMPGLRVGWLVASTTAMERLVELKRLQDCGTSPLIQAALDHFLRAGGLDEHLKKTLPSYRVRRDTMFEALRNHFPKEAVFSRPTGGLFIWVTLPASFDGNALFAAARRRGVLYSRGDLFHGDGSGNNCLRLTYSAADPTEIQDGVSVLGSLIQERWPDGPHEGSPGTAESMPIF
ncbi:MAG: aminotransferase class I/II-fold pyridoxal phosphate-dependent enzyme [Acidobacteria bacterium]|nr:aminotransferase class I/II-fold pyridoxal phosphate-dependent enzyme [Acidobacteriota bacterium]NIM62788.1 aminotransferase class I/II-fold pyridoxal phosphate-dependent enzyme [Acidobacteriota bacterium]NIO60944.1 aminotransferase class I/II-fold pyridoxal phosphate-dependent enzyme [Acidobacteriota bacterium]NIQ31414.1 aminotransferase class I/II-fold pyridoxal phosphate-dependent enzyme [Acidobacteriota bacterium]NIQ87413.1 aminotransferase class I/II-fold pyridoxal phosphate-dependent e